MSGTLRLDLSGFRLELTGLTPAVAEQLRSDWAAFVAHDRARPLLRIHVETLARPGPDGPFRPKAMTSAFRADGARYTLPEGEATVDAAGEASLRLAGGLGRREYWTVVNLLRACLAWRLLREGAALVHAAGLVVGAAAYLLVGAEGAGKTTWATLGEDAGARVVSDDLVLVDGRPTPPRVLGAPFRSTHRGDYRPGSWRLAALLTPRHGAAASWKALSRLRARAALLANLPFVADELAAEDPAGAFVGRLVGAVPCLELTFARDPGFLALLERGPAAADGDPGAGG